MGKKSSLSPTQKAEILVIRVECEIRPKVGFNKTVVYTSIVNDSGTFSVNVRSERPK